MLSTTNGHPVAQYDYDLHGIVGIRLLNATSHDIAAVTRQLGPIEASLQRPPDITIRFVDQLPITAPLHYLGVEDAAYTDNAFLVLRGKHDMRIMVQIPFEQVGGECEIICERGGPAVPLLIPILNLTALNKGFLPIHAAAFRYKQQGVLVTGWSKGGKTETLLAFGANGAEYIGDEWVYISQDGQYMWGIPEPVRVWDWHLETLPYYRTSIKFIERIRLRTLKLMVNTIQQLSTKPIRIGGTTGKFMKRATSLIKQQMHVDLAPKKLFGTQIGIGATRLDKLFFVGSHNSAEISVQPIDPQVIAERMVFSLQEERANFMSYYYKFRFAFPGASNPVIEQAEERQRHLLTQLLAGKAAYELYHPYPVALPLLFDAVKPLLV